MRTHVKYVGEREASETGINTLFNSANCLLAEIRELDATIYTRVVEYALIHPVEKHENKNRGRLRRRAVSATSHAYHSAWDGSDLAYIRQTIISFNYR